VRLPIAALLVGIGWGTQAAAPQRAVPTGPVSPPPPVHVHTIVPRDTLIAVSRRPRADPGGWPLLRRLNWGGPVQAVDVAPVPSRSWRRLFEPIAVLDAFLVAG
jgi:hypothetical protein